MNTFFFFFDLRDFYLFLSFVNRVLCNYYNKYQLRKDSYVRQSLPGLIIAALSLAKVKPGQRTAKG